MKTAVVVLAAAIGACAFAAPAAEAPKFKETVLHSFAGGTDGQYPSSGLTDVNGTLYGTTAVGGSTGCGGSGCGTVFSIDPATGAETVIYSFCASKRCADGAVPAASLLNVNGTLYGTTEVGGKGRRCHSKEGCGTVFSLDPATGTEKVLASFCLKRGCKDGFDPSALAAMGGKLYGTTFLGGTTNSGTAFSIDPDTGAEKVLYNFCSQENCADGANPVAGLVGVKGTLYGATSGGANSGCRHFSIGCGVLFALDPRTGAETVLYTFCSQPNCADGGNPAATLIAENGTLYGTTYDGGTPGCDTDGCGTVFAFDPATGTETVLYAFCQQEDCSDGALPRGGVIDVKGTLYGTTEYGGQTGCPQTGDCGTVFSFDPVTGSETVLHAFCALANCADGWAPEASLTAIKDTLYGTTYEGGADNYGTVFAIKK